MERAGGLTDLAFAEGAVFTREELKEREQKQLETLATRMESDRRAVLADDGAGNRQATRAQALAVGQSLLANLREREAGRTPGHRSEPLDARRSRARSRTSC